MSAENQTDFLWKVHSYTNEYIKFADTKAAFIIAWVSALLGFLVNHDIHQHIIKGESWWYVSGAAWAFFFLIAAFVYAVLVISPRLHSPPERAFIYWSNVRAHDAASQYSAKLREQTDEQLLDHLADHLYTIARIAEQKYERVLTSIRLATVGSVGAVVMLAVGT